MREDLCVFAAKGVYMHSIISYIHSQPNWFRHILFITEHKNIIDRSIKRIMKGYSSSHDQVVLDIRQRC